jgi:hypothetical protein
MFAGRMFFLKHTEYSSMLCPLPFALSPKSLSSLFVQSAI